MKGMPTSEFQPVIYVSMQGFLSTHFTVGIQHNSPNDLGKRPCHIFESTINASQHVFRNLRIKTTDLCKMLS